MSSCYRRVPVLRPRLRLEIHSWGAVAYVDAVQLPRGIVEEEELQCGRGRERDERAW